MNDASHADLAMSPFLKAWEDYLAMSRDIFERLGDLSATRDASTPLPIFGAWQELAKSLGMTSVPGSHGSFKPDELIGSFAPALGWSREYQMIAQRITEIGIQFQRCYAEFAGQSARISEQALAATKARVAADTALAASPDAAYEAWIDSAESAYAQAAHGDAFARSLGELCNLVSAFRIERGKLMDSLARHLDTPTRVEVDSLHRQVRELATAVRTTARPASAGQAKPRRARKPKKP